MLRDRGLLGDELLAARVDHGKRVHRASLAGFDQLVPVDVSGVLLELADLIVVELEDLGSHSDAVVGGDTGVAVDDDLEIPELSLYGLGHRARMMCEDGSKVKLLQDRPLSVSAAARA